MATRARQSLIIFSHNDKKERPMLALVARTGYVNIEVNGQKFYYDERLTYKSLKQVNLFDILDKQENKGKKGIIIISRKRKE